MTIPSQSLTIREILDRYTRGVAVDSKGNVPVYNDGDIDMEKISRMDFGQKHEMAERIKHENALKAQAFKEAQEQAKADEAGAPLDTHRNDDEELATRKNGERVRQPRKASRERLKADDQEAEQE